MSILHLPNLTILDLSTATDSAPNNPFPSYIYHLYLRRKLASYWNIYPTEYQPEHYSSQQTNLGCDLNPIETPCAVALVFAEQKERVFSRSTFESLGPDLAAALNTFYVTTEVNLTAHYTAKHTVLI